MGWYGTYGATRADIIKEQTKTTEFVSEKSGQHIKQVTLAHCIRGSNLWMVRATYVNDVEQDRFIELNLIRSGQGEVAYKPISEEMGPCEVNCPLKYLEMQPKPLNEYSKNWREKVREYHAHNSRKVEAGKTYTLVNCKGIKSVRVLSVRPFRGVADNGVTYRLNKRIIGEEIKS